MLALLLALAAIPTEITLREGERRVVRFEDLSLIAVNDPDILQASATGEKVTLFGAASGTTELRIFKVDGDATVIVVKVSRTAALPEAAELTVEVGTSKTIPITPSRAAEAVDSQIATVDLQGSFLVVRGLAEGRTAVLSTDSHNEKHTAWLTVTPRPRPRPRPTPGPRPRRRRPSPCRCSPRSGSRSAPPPRSPSPGSPGPWPATPRW